MRRQMPGERMNPRKQVLRKRLGCCLAPGLPGRLRNVVRGAGGASMVTVAPRRVSELHMITGILCPRLRNSRSVTKPSITGISTSNSTRSG